MANALQRCTREDITVQTNVGPLTIRAWRLGGFACHTGLHQHEGRWVVTHLETGMSCSSAGTFPSEDQAADAMEQIAAEGDWSDLSEEGRRKLGPMVRRVFAAHGARKG